VPFKVLSRRSLAKDFLPFPFSKHIHGLSHSSTFLRASQSRIDWLALGGSKAGAVAVAFIAKRLTYRNDVGNALGAPASIQSSLISPFPETFLFSRAKAGSIRLEED